MTNPLSYTYLSKMTISFTQAFNNNNLDLVMSYFAENGAVYDQFNDTEARGLRSIREALAPQFRGDYGQMQFIEEEMFCDVQNLKALIAWTCSLETQRGPGKWRGLDILHFKEDGKILTKKTYAKTLTPKFIRNS